MSGRSAAPTNEPTNNKPTTVPILALENVSKAYGAVKAVNDVSLSVDPGERRALIGPNGAGKTTLFNLVGGGVRVTGGKIRFRGEDITKLEEHRRARQGIAKTFQHSNLFDGLSALENVAMAVRLQQGIAHRSLRSADSFGAARERSLELLDTVGLPGVDEAIAGELSHGERRQLEVAVALAIEPTLLLLDEPVAGMSRAESSSFVAMVERLPAELTVLIIEHDMDVVFALATRVTVLHAGAVLAEGAPDDVRQDATVQEAYLGGGEAEELFHI